MPYFRQKGVKSFRNFCRTTVGTFFTPASISSSPGLFKLPKWSEIGDLRAEYVAVGTGRIDWPEDSPQGETLGRAGVKLESWENQRSLRIFSPATGGLQPTAKEWFACCAGMRNSKWVMRNEEKFSVLGIQCSGTEKKTMKCET